MLCRQRDSHRGGLVPANGVAICTHSYAVPTNLIIDFAHYRTWLVASTMRRLLLLVIFCLVVVLAQQVFAFLQLGNLLHLYLVQPAFAQVSLHATYLGRWESLARPCQVGRVDQVCGIDHGDFSKAELLLFVALGCQDIMLDDVLIIGSVL